MRSNMFASPQCLGYQQEHGESYKELCNPPREIVLSQVKKALKKMKTSGLYVAADDNAMIHDFKKEFRSVKVITAIF